MAIFELLHLLAVLVWVGGMFFAHLVLRPAAFGVLQDEQRLRLWDAVLTRFFQWVWLAIGVIFVTGFYMTYLLGGIGVVPRAVHLMALSGVMMTGIYGYVFFACYVPMSVHVSKKSWPEAGAMLAKMRSLIFTNLSLGLFTIVIVVMA